MNEKLKLFLDKVSNLIFPNNFKCIFCGGEIFDDNPLRCCKVCEHDLPYIDGKICECCGTKMVKSLADYCIKCKDTPRFFDNARAVFEYVDKVSAVIKRYKTANAKYLAKPLAMFLAKKYFELDWSVDSVVFVPLHPNAERKRDFNHAKLLAEEFCKISNLPLDQNLIKVKDTKKQTDLDYLGRQSNIEDAFKYKGECAGKNMLVIDDVLTTGATANTIAFELKRKGAKHVYVLTVARTVFKDLSTTTIQKK